MGGAREVKVAKVQHQDLDCSRQAVGVGQEGCAPERCPDCDWLAGWWEASHSLRRVTERTAALSRGEVRYMMPPRTDKEVEAGTTKDARSIREVTREKKNTLHSCSVGTL